MTYAFNPSDLVEGHLIYACDAVAAAADVSSPANAAGRIDVSDYEYLLVGVIAGDGDTDVVVDVQESATATGALATTGTTITMTSASDDNKMKLVEVRCRQAREQYIGFNVTGTGGTSQDIAIFAIGFRPRRSADLATLTTALTEKTLA